VWNKKKKKRVAILSFGWPNRKKKTRKREAKRVQAHTYQKVSILSFSFKLKIEEIFCVELWL